MFEVIITDFKRKTFLGICKNYAKSPVENSSENLLNLNVCKLIYIYISITSDDKYCLLDTRCY